MRKLQTLSLALLAVLLLAACHAHDEYATDQPRSVDVLSRFGTDGKAWLSLDLRIDPLNNTRSGAGTFADGTDGETAVEQLTLVLFRGSRNTAEADMTVASAYTVAYGGTKDDRTQVSHSQTLTLQISNDNLQPDDRLCLLAVANADVAVSAGTRFADVRQTILTSFVSGYGLVMTNAPMAATAEASAAIRTLSDVDPRYMFSSMEHAAGQPAATLWLERTAAKVTATDQCGTHTVDGNTDIDFETSDLKYTVDNYNTTCYLVRQMNAAWLGRDGMVEQQPVDLAHRTYWAEDVNYEGGTGLVSRDHAHRSAIAWQTMGQSQYCAENTTDATHMTDRNTTSLLVRLQLNGGTDFYTVSTTGTDVIYQPGATPVSEEGTSGSESFAPRRSTKVATAQRLHDYLVEWLMANCTGLAEWVDTYAAGSQQHVKLVLSNNAETGRATITAATQTARAEGTAGATAFDALGITDCLAASGMTVYYYEQGYCYYRVPVMHLGRGTALGCYGVVRNNWYELQIERVTHVGSPVIPPLTDQPCDLLIKTGL